MAARNEAGAEKGGAWPYRTLFLYGYFGPGTTAGRALRRRFGLFLVVLGVAGILAKPIGLPGPWRIGMGLVVPVAVAGMVWAYVRYLAALDELSRLIQLEALAFSYGVVLVLGAAWCGLALAGVIPPGALDIPIMFATLVLAEPVRGAVLVRMARRRA